MCLFPNLSKGEVQTHYPTSAYLKNHNISYALNTQTSKVWN